MIRGKKTLVVVMTIAAFGISSAWAAWTVAGNGFGRSRAGALQSVTITPDTVTVAGELYPSASGDLAFTVTSPNAQSLGIVSLGAGSGAFARLKNAVAGSGVDRTAACALSLNTSAVTTWLGTTRTIPGSGSAAFTIANGVSMGSGSDTTCQSQEFDISLTLQAAS